MGGGGEGKWPLYEVLDQGRGEEGITPEASWGHVSSPGGIPEREVSHRLGLLATNPSKSLFFGQVFKDQFEMQIRYEGRHLAAIPTSR